VNHCARVMKSLRWIGTEVCTVPNFDGSNDLEKFLAAYQDTLPEKDWLRALDVALTATTSRWWATHKAHIEDCSQLKTLISARFSSVIIFTRTKYIGTTFPGAHVDHCIEAWCETPQIEWVHRFTSTLDIIPKNRYVKLELR